MKRKKGEDHNELREVPLFASLPQGALGDIAQAARFIEHAPRDAIVSEGGMGLGFHVITHGKAIVSADGAEIAVLGPGDFFGEVALIERTPRQATVAAADERVRTLSLDATDFRWLVEHHPEFEAEIKRAVEDRKR